MNHFPAREAALRLYHDMLRIRMFQEKIEAEYHLDEMKTPVHLYIGQEACAVGVCAHLSDSDYLSSNHRSHGHYLAKGGDMKALTAELYCRKTGCSKGFGGSMHLVDTKVGHMGSSSIVGGGIPIATGLGLAIRMQQKNLVSVVFFSDGAADEGVLYESVNYAILRQLPVVFVYENNGFSVCSRTSTRQATDCVFQYLPSPRLLRGKTDGNDIFAVSDLAGAAVDHARRGEGPAFIELATYRMRGHSGAGSDANLGYRTAEEIAGWEAKCPIRNLETWLKANGGWLPADQEAIAAPLRREIEEAFAFARRSSLPQAEDLGLYLYKDS